MKKNYFKLVAAICMMCGVFLFSANHVQAKNYSVKGSTLFINKKISKNTKFSNPKKIKKIVIKKGISKLPMEPFKKCTNAKVLQVPGNTTFYRTYSSTYRKYTYQWVFPVTLDKVKFTTAIKNEKFYESYYTKWYVVSSKDKKYKSIKGNVYTKKDFELVVVPSECEKLVVANGCKKVNMDAFCYYTLDIKFREDYIDDYNPSCDSIKSVYVPKSVKKICEGISFALSSEKIKFTFKNKIYDTKTVDDLMNVMRGKVFLKVFKDVIQKKGDFYIYNHNYLIWYTGCDEEITIPEGVETIRREALEDNDEISWLAIKKINFPKSMKNAKEIDSIKYENEHLSEDFKYNQMEINVENGNNDYYYCRHKSGQYVKLNMIEDGILSFHYYSQKEEIYNVNKEKCQLYDANKKKITPISIKKELYAEVKKGDVFYLKIPNSGGNNIASAIGDLQILKYFDSKTVTKGMVKGTGKNQYFGFDLTSRTTIEINKKNIINSKNTDVKLQKYIDNNWVDVSYNILDQFALKLAYVDQGKYRWKILAKKGAYLELEYVKETEILPSLGKTKEKAVVLNKGKIWRSGFTYGDGKEAWFKIKTQKSTKVEWYIDNRSNVSNASVEIYKKNKLIKTYKTKDGCSNESFKLTKKGTYYLRIVRKDIKDTVSVELKLSKK